jgi:hypothetical protein
MAKVPLFGNPGNRAIPAINLAFLAPLEVFWRFGGGH